MTKNHPMMRGGAHSLPRVGKTITAAALALGLCVAGLAAGAPAYAAAPKAAAAASPAADAVHFPGNDGQSHTVTFDSKSLMVDGQRLNVFSGEFHYWREPSPDDWRDIFQKMRAAGFNAVSLYFFWGLHSTAPGQFDFTGIKDIDLLLTMAEQEGLYVIARPGPYVNAEISMGGLPAYLTNSGAPSLRSDDPDTMRESLEWIHEFDKIASKHQVTDGGGSIVLYQAENEMPSDTGGRATFMKAITTQVRADGIEVPLFHNDSGMAGRFVPGSSGPGGDVGLDMYAYDTYPLGFTCNAGRGQITDRETAFRNITKDSPQFIAEGQGGAFTPWGASFNTDKCADFVDSDFTRQFGVKNLATGVTLYNNYMEFGGTNWGWTGSPSSGFTSYDYGAALNEDRQLTDKFNTQKQLGYFQQAFPPISDMIPQTAPAVTVDGGSGSINAYQRISTENLADTSVTGNGARLLAFRKSDSNSTSDVSYSFPLTLSEATEPVGKSYTTDDTDTAAIDYEGSWKQATGEAWTSGDYKQTETFSDTTGDSVSYTFNGTGIRVISAQSINHGYGDVYIDGTKVGQTDTYRAQNAAFQYVSFSKDGLTAGQHTIKIVVTGQKDADSAGTFVSIDAFDVIKDNGGTGSTGGTPGDAVSFTRIPQKAGTSLTLHGRDASMVVADYAFNDHDLLYTTSELVATMPTAQGDMLALDGVKGDPGETVLKYASEPTVTTLSGTPVETMWDASNSTLRLNYVHGDPAVFKITGGGTNDLLLYVTDRDQMASTWKIDGTVSGSSDNASVLVHGAELVRHVNIDGDTAELTGDMKQDGPISVYAPAEVTQLSWNGEALATTSSPSGALVADTSGPAPADVPVLTDWKVATGAPEAATSFDDSAWQTAGVTHADNAAQGPGPKQGVVLDTDYYGFYEGNTWYRAHFTATTVPSTISVKGQGGNAAHLMVWINGKYAGAKAANGNAQSVPVPAGSIVAEQDTEVSILVSNSGQNLDWSDNGLSRQNRGLYDANFGSTGPVTWKIQGAKDKAAPVDTARTMYNVGGLYGERAGWYLPGYPDDAWATATSLKPADPGVTWYRTSFNLDVPSGTDTAYAVKINDAAFEADRSDYARAIIYVNGWNTGLWVGNVGPQSTFTIPRGFLNMNGSNDLAISLTTEKPGAGPDSISLVDEGTVKGGIPSSQNEAPDMPAVDVAAQLSATQVTADDEVTLDATSTLPKLIDGALTNTVIDWGDGADPGVSTGHTYTDPGTYKPTVQVTDSVSGAVLGEASLSLTVTAADSGTGPGTGGNSGTGGDAPADNGTTGSNGNTGSNSGSGGAAAGASTPGSANNASTEQASGLARTGSDAVGWGLIALLLMTLGAVAIGRRRSTHAFEKGEE